MKNIQENPSFVVFRGQLYEGERQKAYGEDSFAFGDGEYFSTSFGDASSYAKADTLYNLDLSGNISRIADLHCETYSETKQRILENGDGKVLTAFVSPQRMITFGGEKFLEIPDVDNFRTKFEYSLTMCDIPSDERTRITNFVIKNNHKPKDVYARLAGANALPVLREYAISCNCDAYKLDSELAPMDWVNKRTTGASHITLLDKSRMRILREDNPIVCHADVHVLSTESDVRSKLIDDYSDTITKKEMEITSGMAVTVEALKAEFQPTENKPSPPQPKPVQSEHKPVAMKIR